MARITLSPLIVDIRSKVADMVFSKWRGQNYVRSRVVPANPNTVDQQLYRNTVKWLVEVWQKMPTILKNSWRYYASGMGISGWNAFMSANIKKGTLSQELVLSYANDSTLVLTAWAAGGTGSHSILTDFTPTPVATGKRLYAFAVAATPQYTSPAWVSVAAGVSSPVTLSSLDIGRPYKAYGVLCLATDTDGSSVGVQSITAFQSPAE